MNKKTVVILLILVFVFSAIGLWLSYSNTSGKQKSEQNTGMFLKDLSKQLSLANQVTFSTYKKNELAKILLKKQNKNWLVKVNEQDYYKANANNLIQFFSSLQGAKILETKTSNANLYDRLAVDDIKPDSESMLIVIKNNKDILYSIILGKQDSNNQGQYVRKSNEKKALLINQYIDINTNLDSWIDKTIIKVKTNEIKEIEFQKNELNISRQTVEGTYQITHTVPLNKKLDKNKIASKINQLNLLNFTQLHRDSQIDLPKQKETIVYKKFNGDEVTVNIYKKTETIKQNNSNTDDKESKENEKEQKIEQKHTYYLTLNYQSNSSTDTNEFYAKWVFEIQEYKYKSFNVNSNDLVQDKMDKKSPEQEKQEVLEQVRKQINQ